MLVCASEENKLIDSQDRKRLFALTMNNLGCYYKKIHKPNVALKYMQLALEADLTNQVLPSNLASTKLNICAIYSQINKHLPALRYVKSAI